MSNIIINKTKKSTLELFKILGLKGWDIGGKLGLKKRDEVEDWDKYFIKEFLKTDEKIKLFVKMNCQPLLTVVVIAYDEGLLTYHPDIHLIEYAINSMKTGKFK